MLVGVFGRLIGTNSNSFIGRHILRQQPVFGHCFVKNTMKHKQSAAQYIYSCFPCQIIQTFAILPSIPARGLSHMNVPISKGTQKVFMLPPLKILNVDKCRLSAFGQLTKRQHLIDDTTKSLFLQPLLVSRLIQGLLRYRTLPQQVSPQFAVLKQPDLYRKLNRLKHWMIILACQCLFTKRAYIRHRRSI